MSEHTRDLILALVAGILGVVFVLLMGCAVPDKPFPVSDETTITPWGYRQHCINYPDSIYCEEFPDEH